MQLSKFMYDDDVNIYINGKMKVTDEHGLNNIKLEVTDGEHITKIGADVCRPAENKDEYEQKQIIRTPEKTDII